MRGGSRGRKKQKLRDLSRAIPTGDEVIELGRSLVNAHPTAAGILGAVIVEHDIETLLRDRLARNDDQLWLQLTEDNGPPGTMFRKIQLARALRIIDEPTRHNMHIVRNIRNAFAHSKRLLDFSNELIEAELRDIEIPRYNRRDHQACKTLKYGAKESYLSLCHRLSMHLVKKNIKNLKSSTKRRLSKSQSPFANLLFQTGDPTSANPVGLLGGLLSGLAKSSDKTS